MPARLLARPLAAAVLALSAAGSAVTPATAYAAPPPPAPPALPAPAPPPPAVPAPSWVVADLGTGAVLAARAPHRRMPPASTLKVLTALALLDEVRPDATYVARPADVVEGTKVGMVPGGRYTAHELFEGLFLSSGNDAASGLAALAGGEARTVRLMNERAAALGATATVAANPSGLDAPGQLTTAYDLAVLARAGLARADFRRYAATARSTFPGKGGRRFEIGNRNRFLTGYAGAIGVKNGYTTLARQTLVAAATRGGRTLVVVLLGAQWRPDRQAAALMDWGFAAAARPVPPEVALLPPLPPAGAAPTPTAAPAASAAPAAGGAVPAAAGPAQAGFGGPPWGLLVTVAPLALVAGLRARVLARRALRRRRALARRSPPRRIPRPAVE